MFVYVRTCVLGRLEYRLELILLDSAAVTPHHALTSSDLIPVYCAVPEYCTVPVY